MDLFNFLNRWLPGMTRDGVLVGPNRTGDLIGMEVEPIEVREAIADALTPERAAEYLERYEQEISRNDDKRKSV